MSALLSIGALGAVLPGTACAQTGTPPADAPEVLRFGDDLERAYDEPFFPGTEYDESVATPESFLARPVGSRLARHDEIVRVFEHWGETSDRVDVAEYGRTHEGRPLLRVVITSPENHARLATIKRAIARLADPRGLTEPEARAILDSTPAIAWMGYSIHGDETSGTDASLAVAYHLAAGTSADVLELLREVVVVMDPCLNPDGRQRILTQIEQSAGYVANLDHASMQRGRWPYGRGNHYLFDMNRDWMVGVAPETRGRWRVALEFHPQLFVDAHEMSGLDTYLFYPQADPVHPAMPATLMKWQKAFAAANAAAFDRYGWGYYTREWADGWGAFYSDSWGSLNGAIGMLYEQAGVGGQPLKRASGEIVSYREAVHGQAVSSVSNLTTLARERRAVLADYLAGRRRNVDRARPGGDRAFVLVPGRNPSREARFLDLLLAQGIEVQLASAAFTARECESPLAEAADTRTFEAGAYLVHAAQPQAGLVAAYLDFDTRMDDETVLEERRSLERKGESKMYDVTAWDLGRAFDLDCTWCTPGPVDGAVLETVPELARGVVPSADGSAPVYAFAVDGADDASVRFAVRAMELGLAVHLADEAFQAGGQEFPRGSLLLRRHENAEAFEVTVHKVADEAGVRAFALATGRSEGEGPDLGGGHFHLLARPRVAVLSNAPVRSDGFGHIWQLLDERLRLPMTMLDAQRFGGQDLRRYNVLVLPPGSIRRALAPHAKGIAAWVRSGGTLIACGSSVAGVLGEEFGLSSVVLRRDALEDLDAFAYAAERERSARDVSVDFSELWGDGASATETESDGDVDDDEASAGADASATEADEADEEDEEDEEDGDLEQRDGWMRRFAPAGAILRGIVNEDEWITVGAGPELPVPYSGSRVLLAREPVRTPVRMASPAALRLAGLLWPEARERIADSAWLTVESVGHGQLILFAAPPAFRGWFAGTARLFANAVVYGPGLGADQPLGW